MNLSHRGLRAADRDLVLGKLNLFRGPVGSGKSTALDAVALAALGFVPRVGRSDAATRSLVRGSEASVRLTLDDGRTIEREVGKAPGSRSGCRVSWSPKAKLTEAQGAAAGLFGATLDESERLVDIRALLKASGKERARLVDALLDAGAKTTDHAARLRRLLAARLAGIDESRVPADADGQRTLSGSPVFDAVAAAVAETLAKNGLAAAIEDAKDRKNRAAADAREKTTARGALEDRLAAAKAPAEAAAAVKARRDAAVAAKASAEERRAAADRQDGALMDADRDLTAARLRLDDLLGTPEPTGDTAALRAEADSIVDPAPPAADPVEVEQPGVAAEVARLRETAARDSAAADAVRDPAPPARIEPSAEEREAVQAIRDEADRKRAQAAGMLEGRPAVVETWSEAHAVTVAEAALKSAEAAPWREVERIADGLDTGTVRILFDGPPAPEAGRFVEAEDEGGRSIICGEWSQDGNLHVLRLRRGAVAAEREIVERLRALAKTHGGDVSGLRLALETARVNLEAANRRKAAAEADRADREKMAADLVADAKTLADRAAAMWSEAVIAATAKDAEARAAWESAKAAADKERAALRASAETARKAADRTAKQEADRVSAINRERAKAQGEARAAWEATTAANTDRRRALRAKADALTNAVAQRAAAVAKARADVDAAKAKLDGIAVATYDAEADAAAIMDASATVSECDALLAAHGAAEARRTEMRALLAEIERADALRAAWAAAEWALAKIRDDDLAARASRLTDRMRVFLRGAGRSEEPYVLCEGGATDFGWRRADGEAVSLDGAASGGESVLLLAALSTAVVSLARPEVAVLLVEAAELHGEAAASLLGGCEAVADGFDAILVAGPAAMPERAGWTVFDVAREAADAAKGEA